MLKRNAAFLLSFLLSFHLVTNYIWLKIDSVPLIFDSHEYFMSSLYVFDAFKTPPFGFLSNIVKAVLEARRPSLFVQLVTVPFYAIFGRSEDIAVISHVFVFLFVLIFSVYRIGKKIADKRVGLLAAFIITLYPIIFNQMRVYMLDLPLTSMTALSIYLLLCTADFTNLRYSIAFGISCGLSMLIKANFLIFILCPLSIILVKSIFEYFRQSQHSLSLLKRKLQNFFYSSLTAAIIFLPLYVKFLNLYLVYPQHWGLLKNPGFLWRFVSLIWYFKTFIENQLSFLFFAIFIIGMVFFLFHFKNNKAKYTLLSWIIPPFFLISLYLCFMRGYSDMEWMYVRYTMPILPAVAIITAIGLSGILGNLKLRSMIVSLLFCAGLIQFFAISYGMPALSENLSIRMPFFKNNVFLPQEIVFFKQPLPLPCSHFSYPLPGEERWLENTLGLIKNNSDEARTIRIAIINDIAPLWAYLRYKTYNDKLPFIISGDLPVIFYHNVVPYEQLILGSDYVIIKTGDWSYRCWVERPYYLEETEKAMNFFKEHINSFNLAGRVKVSGDSEVLIYKKAGI